MGPFPTLVQRQIGYQNISVTLDEQEAADVINRCSSLVEQYVCLFCPFSPMLKLEIAHNITLLETLKAKGKDRTFTLRMSIRDGFSRKGNFQCGNRHPNVGKSEKNNRSVPQHIVLEDCGRFMEK